MSDKYLCVCFVGQESWPPGCCLKYVSGCQFGTRDRLMVESLESFQTCTLCLDLISPDKSGYYQGQWRMCTPTGLYFGGNNILLYFLYLIL